MKSTMSYILRATSRRKLKMSVRRDIRLRKEFLLKKHQEALSTARDEKKRKLKRAIDEKKAIPTEIRSESRQLHHELELDVHGLDETKAWYDDEYANIGVIEPKVCVTTSRDPSSRLKQFSK